MNKEDALKDLRIRTALAIADVIAQNPFPIGLIMALALNESSKTQARIIMAEPEVAQ